MVSHVVSPPLVNLAAVSLDTETTGLNVRTARLVQIGAVRTSGSKLDMEAVFETLVDPGTPIPESSTAIHGISDADVEGAPAAAVALPALAEFLGDAIVIGHAIAYDIEILRREAEGAGVDWRAPRALDVRILAEKALPGLASYSLDALCDYHEITVEGRHRALGDAVATGRLFAALLPALRRQGIRSLAEAEAACRRRVDAEAATGGGLPVAPSAGQMSEETRAPSRVDSYPYRHRVSEVMSSPAVTLPGDGSLREAVDLLVGRGVSSVIVESAGGNRGIVTERDVLRALHARGSGALATPLHEVWSAPLECVGGSDLVYRAIGRMDRLSIRHLGVVDEGGQLVGAVTTRNLLRHRAATAMILGDELAVANDVAELAAAIAGSSATRTWIRA